MSSLRRYRAVAMLAAFSLVLSAFGPLVPCAMEAASAPPTESLPCHDEAMAMDVPMAHPMAPSVPAGHDDAPCAEDACCVVRAPVAPRTETAPDLTASSILVLAVAIGPFLPEPTAIARPAPSPEGSPPVSRSILYGCLLT